MASHSDLGAYFTKQTPEPHGKRTESESSQVRPRNLPPPNLPDEVDEITAIRIWHLRKERWAACSTIPFP